MVMVTLRCCLYITWIAWFILLIILIVLFVDYGNPAMKPVERRVVTTSRLSQLSSTISKAQNSWDRIIMQANKNSSHYNIEYIFFDWVYPSEDFSYINYKSFESFLACCYHENMKIEIVVISPKMANYYKFGNIMR